MLITAKFTKLSCFVNTVLQLCLILRKLLILCRLRPLFANHMWSVRALTTNQPCLILMRSSDVAGQGHLTPFSSGQLTAYKTNF